ncbi:FapA family protein [Sporosarcina obsidiansis]|uniref:FapA family protein n=1 Tax=Sporosarcina obsidiansis TaxID=2660748 RepID=UPI00129AA29B|nr:FapA family protein [Sporosarcina obsidiansis]
MARSITIRAETVEKALEQALEMLGLTLDDVHVQVQQPPSRSMFGLKKVWAEVTVTEVGKKRTVLEDTQTVFEERSGVRIFNGQLEVCFAEGMYPMVIPSTGVQLQINNELIAQRTILLPTDKISLCAVKETLAAQFVIQLAEDHMIAIARVTPGKIITRTLEDTSWETVLNIETIEEIQNVNELETKMFIEELRVMGIENGLCMDEIKEATNTLEAKEFVIARGTFPIESRDATLDIHLNFDKQRVEEHERVDFREHTQVPTVQEGQLIATYIPPVEGVAGESLLGEIRPVKPPKDIVLRIGKQVESSENHLYAKIDGRPVIEWRGNLVKVDVNREYQHSADVNLESGNIYFDGDVWIGGSIHPSMFVAASGTITIMKNSTKASIRGTKSVCIKGSIFSSTVTVGIQEKIISMLVKDLSEVLTYLRNIDMALVQIFTLRGEKAEDVPPFILKQAIRLLLEQKYGDFTQVNKQFIQVVKNHSRRLEKEWSELSDRLYILFVDPLRDEQTTILYLRQLIEEADLLLRVYGEEEQPESVLQAAFALNSILYSNGKIHIMSKGVYNCSITALHDIVIKGVCRGGEVIGGRDIELDETGSSAGVKTKIQTNESGVIRIGTAYPGTVIHIGNQRYEFFTIKHQVTAQLNSEGLLIIA